MNDADRLGRDPAMRWIVGGRAVTEQAASTSQMGRFETSAMTSPTNLTALADLSGRWIDRAQARRARTALVLDIDSSVSPTYGAQEGTAYNGHFECTCYHPLFVFNQDGDLERCALRPGNVHSAHGWREVLDPVVARYRGQAVRRFCAAMRPSPCPTCTSTWRRRASSTRSVCPPTRCSRRRSRHLLTRPGGSASALRAALLRELPLSGAELEPARRVVAKVEWHPGELYPRASAPTHGARGGRPQNVGDGRS